MVYMDSMEVSWLAEMGLDNSIFMDQWDFMDSLDEQVAAQIGHDFGNCLSAGINSPSSPTLINVSSSNSINSLSANSPPTDYRGSEPPAKLQKPNNFSKFLTIQTVPNPDRASSAPVMLNFGNTADINPRQVVNESRALNPDEEASVWEVLRSHGSLVEPEEQSKRAPVMTTKKTSRVRPRSQSYDHIIAERKRREQLSQRFVALSTIVPGLTKMDKTSVLGDAIKYLKHLQERVKMVEEQATKQTMESVILVKKSQIMAEENDNEGSSDEKSVSSDEQPMPEIEARVCNTHILLRVHCQKQKGVLVNLLSEVEKVGLSVVNTNVTPFGRLALDITMVAEMEKEFDFSERTSEKTSCSSLGITLC